MVIPQIVRADFLGQKKDKLKTSELMSSKRHETMAVCCKTMKQTWVIGRSTAKFPRRV